MSIVPKIKRLLELDPYLCPFKGEIERRYTVLACYILQFQSMLPGTKILDVHL